MDLPMLKFFIQCFNPLRDSGLSSVDFLPAAYKTNDGCPVFSLVKRPNQKGSFRHREIRHFQFISVGSTTFKILCKPFMSPGTLGFIKYCNMLNLTKSSFFKSYCLLRIDFKLTILNRILNLRQHIITIPVNHLYGFSYFTTGIRYILFLVSLFTVFYIISCKSFC